MSRLTTEEAIIKEIRKEFPMGNQYIEELAIRILKDMEEEACLFAIWDKQHGSSYVNYRGFPATIDERLESYKRQHS